MMDEQRHTPESSTRELRLSTAPDPGSSLLEIVLELAGRVTALLAAVAVSFLPRAWRIRFPWHDRLPLVAGTAVSSVIQCVVVLWVLFESAWYRAGDAGEPLANLAHGHVHVLFLVTIYFLFEAGMRFLSALTVGEPLGTLPLWLAERGQRVMRTLRAPRRHVVLDRVSRDDDGTVIIETVRRRIWDAASAVSIDGAYYRVRDAMERPDAARPFVYRLAPLPPDAPVKAVHVYTADEPGVSAQPLPEARVISRN